MAPEGAQLLAVHILGMASLRPQGPSSLSLGICPESRSWARPHATHSWQVRFQKLQPAVSPHPHRTKVQIGCLSSWMRRAPCQPVSSHLDTCRCRQQCKAQSEPSREARNCRMEVEGTQKADQRSNSAPKLKEMVNISIKGLGKEMGKVEMD